MFVVVVVVVVYFICSILVQMDGLDTNGVEMKCLDRECC